MVRRFSPFLLAVLALSVANPLSAAPPAPPKPQEQVRLPAAKARPVGVWVRDVGPVKIVLRLTADRLTATAIFASGQETSPVVRLTLDADYAVAKDGTLFGVVFGADATQPMYATVVRLLDGQPFAFGWRVDGDTLTVRSLKCLGAGLRPEATAEPADFDVFVNGRYTRIEEAKLPEWEKKFAAGADPLMNTVVGGGLTAPPTKPVPSAPPLFRHVPGKCEAPSTLPAVPAPSVSIPVAPAATTTPPVVYADPAPAPTASPQPLPVTAPPLDSRGATLPQPVATPQPLPEVPPQAVPQPPTVAPSASLFGQPAPPPPASTLPPVPNPLVGTWTRDVGAFRATFTFTPKQLVVHMHVDPTGKKDFQELIFIVEYKLTADGKRFEGTVIGADAKIREGVPLLNANETLRGAREVDGQPMQFEFRVTEGLLLVRGVGFGADGKSCSLLTATLPGVYAQDTAKVAKASVVPASAESVERTGCKVEASGPVPVLPPLRDGALPDAPPPPCIHDVLKALPPAPRGVPFVFEVSRENIEQTARVVKELEADKLDPPRFYPLVGHARLHHATWKCTVTFTETITSDYPLPFKTTHERVEVVRVPQMSLYRYVLPEVPGVPPAPKCKDCAPSLKPIPGGSEPVPPIPMSRG